jgi:hypothetical protein
VHLLLAKVIRGDVGKGGVKDISLFIVPKYLSNGKRNDWKLIGINHKLGFRGAVNTALSYGDNDECIGYIIGIEFIYFLSSFLRFIYKALLYSIYIYLSLLKHRRRREGACLYVCHDE